MSKASAVRTENYRTKKWGEKEVKIGSHYPEPESHQKRKNKNNKEIKAYYYHFIAQ